MAPRDFRDGNDLIESFLATRNCQLSRIKKKDFNAWGGMKIGGIHCESEAKRKISISRSREAHTAQIMTIIMA